jgi:quercetin dioxygenase-like cupin family protein
MQLRKYRWSKHYESAEEELTVLLAAKHITAERWAAEGMQVFASRTNTTDKRLWCAEGSIIFSVDGKRISLQPGDALEIPANTPHEAIVGMSGCVCYEQPDASKKDTL